MAGKFIVFEGGEGAGKTTQIVALAAALAQQGREVVTTREPGGTSVGTSLRALLLDPRTTIAPRAETLLYAADRADHVAAVIRPAMARDAVVISDRYVDSSIAYQGAGRGHDAAAILKLSLWAADGLLPDLTVLLDLDPRVGLARAGTGEFGEPDRFEQEKADFHDRVRAGFLARAATDPARYLVLDATRPAADLAADIAAATTVLAGP